MNPRTYSTQGIILSRRNYGEADRIVVIYSKDYGKIALMAKGVRKPSSRKRGHIEVFSHIIFSATKTRNLDLMTEAENIDSFPEVRKSLPKISLAYYFMEVVGKTTHGYEEHREVYDLLLEYLNRLKKEKSLKNLRLGFILELLIVLGFWPKGKKLVDPDQILEEITERQIYSKRIGKRVLE